MWRLWLLALLLLTPLFAQKAEKQEQLLLAHYMPWYQSKATSGSWGWHWTMNRFDPEKNGLASHHTPLLGAYDSTDPHLLEYHVQLMKLSGLDGVIIDWYGISQANDYPFIHKSTQLLIQELKRANLKFALCYEDRSIPPQLKNKSAINDIAAAQKDLLWSEKHWFRDPAYLKQNGHPLLIVFGPIHFKTAEAWNKILQPLASRPHLHTLPHLSKLTRSDSVFGWPPVHGGKTIPPEKWTHYLQELYQRKDQPIAIAFPKYHDIYPNSYGFIDDQNGQTFSQTLDLALNSSSSIIQIATWNDHGEGTTIETHKRIWLSLSRTPSNDPSSSKASVHLARSPPPDRTLSPSEKTPKHESPHPSIPILDSRKNRSSSPAHRITSEINPPDF